MRVFLGKKYKFITTAVKTKYGKITTVRLTHLNLNDALSIINEIYHILKEIGFNPKLTHTCNKIRKLWKTKKKVLVLSFKNKENRSNIKMRLLKPNNPSKREIILVIEERKNKKKKTRKRRKRRTRNKKRKSIRQKTVKHYKK